MLKFGSHDDSSEEDEDISPMIISEQQESSESSSSQHQIPLLYNESTQPVSLPSSQAALPLHLFKAAEEEEDEEDAPLLPAISSTNDEETMMNADASSTAAETTLITSQEFTEAYTAIGTDPWDCLSWIVLIEEAEQGRGGSMTPEDAYLRFIAQFPRAHKYWNKLIQLYLQKKDFVAAEASFAKCLNKSRSVDLWMTYIDMTKLKFTVETSGATKTLSQIAIDRQNLELAYEKAVQAVGMAPQAGILWRAYLDFVRDWPEQTTNVDTGRKLLALRKLYQHVLCVPMEGLEQAWREYEMLEQAAGQLLAERVLPEYQEKYLHAAAVYKERSRACQNVDFDRLAIPPTHSVVELRQLQAWDAWVQYEKSNPDHLPPDQLRDMLLLVFDQFLACFRLHPEVWIELSRLEQGQVPPRITEARAVLKEGIELIPDIALLRIGLAEFEESQANFEAAREAYRGAFEAVPCALTFSSFQKFVRRREGIHAARRLFSETLTMRVTRKLGIDVYVAHAQLELDVNCDPQVALNVLNLARAVDAANTSDLNYVRLLVRVLLRLGDLKQIRWVYQSLLGDDQTWSSSLLSQFTAGSSVASNVGANVITSGVGEALLPQQEVAAESKKEFAPSILSLSDQYHLWDDYLLAESTLGLSSVTRLDELRANRNRVKAMLIDMESAKLAAGMMGISSELVSLRASSGIFQASKDLCERYMHTSMSIPPSDDALRQRSRGRRFLDEQIRSERDKVQAMKDALSAANRGKRNRENAGEVDNAVTEAALAGVPAILREFVSRLPSHYSGATVDSDALIRQLKTTILPPKPSIEDSEQLNKRRRMALAGETRLEDEVEEVDEVGDIFVTRDDIFRRRQRERLLVQ